MDFQAKFSTDALFSGIQIPGSTRCAVLETPSVLFLARHVRLVDANDNGLILWASTKNLCALQLQHENENGVSDPEDGVAETVLADASVHFENLQVRLLGEPKNQPGEFLRSDGTAEFTGKREFVRPP